jgi:hypothetical protein
MDVVIQIPDEIAAAIRNGSNDPVSRRVLELTAIQAHEADLITEYEVMELLGFEDREELYAFFKQHDVRSKYSIDDLNTDLATLSRLLDHK